jgi:outer membrane protein TolC
MNTTLEKLAKTMRAPLTPAPERVSATELFNATEVDRDAAVLAMHRAKSELGTAEAELNNHRAQLTNAEASLDKLLPKRELPAPPLDWEVGDDSPTPA